MGNRPSDNFAILSTIDPDAYTASTYTGDWADTEYFETFAAIVEVGTMATSSTVDFVVKQATSSTGAGVKAVTGAAITQLTQGGTDSDKQAIIEFNVNDLDLANGFRYVAPVLTVGTAASDSSAMLLGFRVKHGPARGHDLSTVDEIVNLI